MVDSRPRVAFVITDSGIGGTERVLDRVMTRMLRDQYPICGVVCLKSRREMGAVWESRGVPVRYLDAKKGTAPEIFWRLKSILDEWSPDVVHAFLFHSVFWARGVKKISGSFLLATSPRVNYRFAPRFARWADRLLAANDDGVLCESRSTKEYLISEHGYLPDKIVVVPNAVDSELFRFDEGNRQRLRRAWNVDPHHFVFGAVGRLHFQKGFDVLLEAFRLVYSMNQKCRLIIIGEGPEHESLSRFIEKQNLPVQLAGRVNHPETIYSGFDSFVLSSRYEGMPNVLLEAFSTGLPCVATAVDGVNDVAVDGKNIVLVRPENAESLASGMALLLEKKDLRRSLAAEARRTAEAHAVDRMAAEFERFYDQLWTDRKSKK